MSGKKCGGLHNAMGHSDNSQDLCSRINPLHKYIFFNYYINITDINSEY